MKIDLVSDRRDGQGGMETVFTLLSKELERQGFDVRVVLAEPSIQIEWESTLGGQVYHIMDDKKWVDRSDYDRYRKLQRIEIELFYKTIEPPDVVLVATRSFEAPVRNALGDRAVIFSWPHLNLNLRITDDAEDFKVSDGFLALCDSIRKQSVRKNPMLPAFTIGNPVDINVAPIRRATDIPTFLYMGRITEQKRVDWIIKAFGELKQKNWKLKIVGGGELEKPVMQLAHQLGIYQRIEWVPFQENPWQHVQEVSALLLSSWFEGFPMIILESLARGVPVIATDCPVGPSDSIIHGHNGYLVGVEDFESFVDTIYDVIDGDLSLPEPDVCRASVAKYESSMVVNRLMDAINTLQKVRGKGITNEA